MSYPDTGSWQKGRGFELQPLQVPAHATSEPIPATVVDEPARPRMVALPLILFATTCYTTFQAGVLLAMHLDPQSWVVWPKGSPVLVLNALSYAVPLMFILLCHEFGHFIQAQRYGVPASFPFFLPMSLSPLGTMGAVIAMKSHKGDRKALFDIAITGPIAGLIPSLICCAVALQYTHYAPVAAGTMRYGDPLLLQGMYYLAYGPMPAGHDVMLNPLLFAGWAGVFVTGLNLIPIGQLDGGHILYALFRKRAHFIATALLYASILTVIWLQLWTWCIMLTILIFIGPRHPETADDNVELGPVRTLLGVLALLFVIIGFTPRPLMPTP